MQINAEICGIVAATKFTGLSRGTVYRWIASGKFPTPVFQCDRSGETIRYWTENQLRIFMEKIHEKKEKNRGKGRPLKVSKKQTYSVTSYFSLQPQKILCHRGKATQILFILPTLFRQITPKFSPIFMPKKHLALEAFSLQRNYTKKVSNFVYSVPNRFYGRTFYFTSLARCLQFRQLYTSRYTFLRQIYGVTDFWHGGFAIQK